MLSDADLDALASWAADAVVLAVRWGPAEPMPRAVQTARTDRGASFVTLHQAGAVRGCVGSPTPHRPLQDDVAHNARAAALHDPRFDPLTPAELPSTLVDVAVLNSPTRLTFSSEAALYRQLRPGTDGLIVSHRDAVATYLPDVWLEYPEPHRFVAELRAKAGIDPAIAITELRFERYGAQQSNPVRLDRVVRRRQDVSATWWRWRSRARARVKRLARRQSVQAGQ